MQKLLNFFSILGTRIGADSPKFFQKVRSVSLWVASLSATATPQIQAIIIKATGLGLDVPPIVNTIATYVTVAGLVAAGIAKLTVDPTKLTDSQANSINVTKP